MVYKIPQKVKPGDKITVSYVDNNGVTLNLSTHTVGAPTNAPTTTIDVLPNTATPAPCDKVVDLRTVFQRNHNGAIYNSFCSVAGIKARTRLSGAWQAPITSDENRLFRYYNEITGNLHRVQVPIGNSSSTYQIEYATASTNFTGAASNTCNHYLSNSFTYAQANAINPLARIGHSVGGTPAQTLERNPTGNKLYIGGDAANSQLAFITKNNKLTVRLDRTDGQPNVQTITATGPWNLAGNYTVKFPYIKQVWPEINSGNGAIYQFIDLPVGNYKLTLSDQCGNPPVVHNITINSIGQASHTLNTIITTDCARNGQTSKGKIQLRASITKDLTAGLGNMLVYKDLDNGLPIHKRVGVAVKSISLERSENLVDLTKYDYNGEIGDLEPGKYLLGINVGACMFSVVDRASAEANGYMVPYNDGKVCGTKIYKFFEIKNITDVTPVSAIGMCDPSNPNTGVIRVEMPTGSEPKYPITYTLYKVSGGTKTVVTQGGNEVKKVVTDPPVAPAPFSDAFATFNDIPRLTGGDTYEVKFESGCLDRWVPVPDFGSLTAPDVHASVAQACFNQPMTLSVDLSESLYDIQWKSDPANAFDGVPGADL